MMQSESLWTDAFGTRLEPDALVAGVRGLGLAGARLRLCDDGLVLEHADPDPRSLRLARATTWLRSRLSPLTPVHCAQLEPSAATSQGWDDARTVVPRHVAVVEVPWCDAAARLTPETDVGTAEPGGAGLVAAMRLLLERLVTADTARGDDALTGARVTPWSDEDAVSSAAIAAAWEAANPGKAARLGYTVRRDAAPQRDAIIVAASFDEDALRWFGEASGDSLHTNALAAGRPVWVNGLAWKAARRPVIAGPPSSDAAVVVDAARCDGCGVCAGMCPVQYLDGHGRPTTPDPSQCIRCSECIDACPRDALRPSAGADTATLSPVVARRPGWLARVSGAPGPSVPAPFTPSFLRPRPTPARGDGPRWVLGLAVMTMQEHGAVLLRDGEVFGALEHERVTRRRHAGWHPRGRPGVTAAVDPTIVLEETFCRRSIRWLLQEAGITLDDLDAIAVNGLHGRFVDRIPFIDADEPIPSLQVGRTTYFPHHLCHAASTLRASGLSDAWVLSADGRGDRECLAIYRADGGELRLRHTLLALDDRSLGGVYEGVTRLLGFGSHGQGSVMALAAFGTPSVDFSAFLHAGDDAAVIHEHGIDSAFEAYRRAPDAPLEQRHKDLAASLQHALEAVVVAELRRVAGDGPIDALCVAGGVTLNCRMNERLRRTFLPREMFAQPGANDAGTALGAALEADRLLATAQGVGETAWKMTHAWLGPAFDDDTIEAAIRRSGLAYTRVDDVAEATAARIADGEVVCWFQGRMEFGPRALGARSILADPRRAELHARVNAVKTREAWRPFGPSILSGHENDYLENGFDARFMLFTMPVAEAQRDRVPAIVHVDGTTRPQIVHRDATPIYHRLIEAFHGLTGVPMVLNTSFNRRGEPIVCTPDDALDALLGLGADLLAIGSFHVFPRRASLAPAPRLPAELAALRAQPTGRRLALRLTMSCDLACGHCTLRDQPWRNDRDHENALRALADGRRAGCDEVVFLRGEAALRDDLPTLVHAARAMGYRFVQLQTNAAALADPARLQPLLRAGVDTFEVMWLAADEATSDALTGTTGVLRTAARVVQVLRKADRDVLVSVPVLRANVGQLGGILAIVHKIGVRRVQLVAPRPAELPDHVQTEPLLRLPDAAGAIANAAAMARRAGLEVTTEGVPLCLLPDELHAVAASKGDPSRHRIDDLHILHASIADAIDRERFDPPPCRRCTKRDMCPRPWPLEVELQGSDMLRPFA